MTQKHTSKGTSINSSKAPRIVSLLRKHKMIDEYSVVFDYGAGRYPEITREALNVGMYLPFDPFNLPEEVNSTSIDEVIDHGCGLVMCSNVLNVIDDDETITDIILRCLAKTSGPCCFTVYEGDGTGKGRETGPDQYQRNEPLEAYLRFFRSIGCKAQLVGGKHGMIVAC